MGIEASVCPRWPPGGPSPAGSLTGALGAELVGHVQQRQQGHQAVVTIGLNEVMTCNGCRVNVMLPEWSDESLGWGREAGVGDTPDSSAFGAQLLPTVSCTHSI